MNQKTTKILSVDFDFFQEVTREILHEYPDGCDLSTSLSEIVWGSRCAKSNPNHEMILSVKLAASLYYQMLNIISRQSPDIPVLIAQSHVSIYDFLLDAKEDNPEQPLEIINVDLHHDLFNDNPDLDCGNWLRHIKEEYNDTIIHWIARPVSLECYAIKDEDRLGRLVETDLKKIRDMQFDAIFICRSDAWLPPHLDKHFDRLVGLCSAQFTNVRAQKCILKPRDISAIIEAEDKIWEDMWRKYNANSNSTTEQET